MTAADAAPDIEGTAMPKWLRGSSLAWGGAVLAGLVIALTTGFLFHESRALEASEIQSAELYARVLQDHVERAFDTIDITLGALAEGAAERVRSADTAHLDQDLAHATNGLSFLRSLSVLTPEGRVIASSSAANIGVTVDLAAVRWPARQAGDVLGAPVDGRDLRDAPAGARGTARSGQTFVPIVRALGDPAQAYLVAVVNPDFFANEDEPTRADPTRAAGIFSAGGVLLAGTGNLRMRPGDSARAHRFFTEFLPARESGSFVGAGIDGTEVVTAFRLLRKRPVAVIVERSHAQVVASFRQTLLWALGICGAVLAGIAATLLLGRRSLLSHRAVSAALEATRADITTSEHDLRLLVESVHELIFRADANGRINFVNGRWRELTQRPDSDAIGKRLTDLCRPDERAACRELFSRPETEDETALVHVDDARGRSLTLDLSMSRLRKADGTTMGFAGFALDVSARETAQQALESQLKFTARLLEVSPTPIFVKDDRGRFVTVNRAWLDLMNLTLPEALGRTSDDLFGHDAPKHNDQDARLLESEERISYENRLFVGGRQPRDTIVTKVRFTRADGTPAGIVGSIIDVTEFRAAERSIREARDAAQIANSAKSEFIANISHELRTPLQGIIGFSEVGRDLAGELPDFLEMFTDIHASGQRMLTLVNGLLDVSSMDSAAGSLPLQRVDVAQVVRDAVGQLRSKSIVRDLKVNLHGLDEPVDADVDRVRFQQAVRNVLANAVRYSPIGGVVDVTLSDRGPAGIDLSVRDHGPGVPEDELELIFEAFVQSSRTRDGSGGTGLGLTITRKIMSAHGGSIVAANAPGGGALISLSLPAAGVVNAAHGGLSWQDPDQLLFANEVN